jgi:hypothetical protein
LRSSTDIEDAPPGVVHDRFHRLPRRGAVAWIPATAMGSLSGAGSPRHRPGPPGPRTTEPSAPPASPTSES